MGKYRRSAGTLFGVTFLFWFSQYAYTPYLNPQLQAMGATATLTGLVGGAYGFTQLLARLPLGVASDRLGRQKLFILGGCLLSSLSALGMYLWDTPMGFLVFRGVGGLAAASWVAFTVLYSSYFPAERSSQAITMLNVANQAGRLSCFVSMAFLVERLGTKSSFLLSGTAALTAACLCLVIQDTDRSGPPIRFRELPQVCRNRKLLVCTLLAVLTQLVAFSTYSGFAVNYAVSLGAAAAQLSAMNIAMVLPLVISNYLAAKYWLPRLGARRLLTAGFGLTLLYCFGISGARSVAVVYGLQAMAGVANSLTMSVLLGICVEDIPSAYRATAMGFFQAMYGIGMTVGPVLMGICTDHAGLGPSFLIMGGFAAAALGITLFLEVFQTFTVNPHARHQAPP